MFYLVPVPVHVPVITLTTLEMALITSPLIKTPKTNEIQYENAFSVSQVRLLPL